MIEYVKPNEIERRSFEIIRSELPHPLDPFLEPIIMRVIHTTADFEYADSLIISQGAVENAIKALQEGVCIVSDTNMVKAGVDKMRLAGFGGDICCFMDDKTVAETAKENGTTRAYASMDKAASISIETGKPFIFAIGNAPTALMRLCELMADGKCRPVLVIGVPVGFVNVTEAKEMLINSGVPHIVARGRKGGSNVAAAICNALLRIAEENNYE